MLKKEVSNLYELLSKSKYTKLEDLDKIKVWKIVKELKPIANKLEEDIKDAQKKFSEEFDNFEENLSKAQEYERMKQKNSEESLPMTENEYNSFIQDYIKYNSLMSKAINEIYNESVDIKFEKLSEDAFGKLMSSNDWTMEQVSIIGDFICE